MSSVAINHDAIFLLVRVGCGFCWFGSDLLCHPNGNVPVGCQTECGGRKLGKKMLFVLNL